MKASELFQLIEDSFPTEWDNALYLPWKLSDKDVSRVLERVMEETKGRENPKTLKIYIRWAFERMY